MQKNSIQNDLVLLKTNWRLCISANLIAAIAYLLFIPLMRGISNLDAVQSAECLEQSAALTGILLLVPLSSPEQNRAVQDSVFIRKKSYASVLLLRICLALCALSALIVSFAGIMTGLNCVFPYWPYVFGTIATALILGGCGLLASAVAGSTIAGYFLSCAYYMLGLFGGEKILGDFSLFSMGSGDFTAKYLLTAAGAFCLFLSVLSQKLRGR